MLRPGDSTPGQHLEEMNLTNIFGSQVLRTGWSGKGSGAGRVYETAYQCATGCTVNTVPVNDPDNTTCPQLHSKGTPEEQATFAKISADCTALPPLEPDPVNGGVQSVVDELGRPLLKNYPGAFTGSETMWGMAKAFSTLAATPLKITKDFPFTRTASVQVPLYANPYGYASTSTPSGTFESLIPAQPLSDSVGFFVPINSERWGFIPGREIDFTGNTWDGNINLRPVIDAKGNTTADNVIASVETDEYDGLVFMCKSGPDLLGVRMFDSAETILEWIANHPSNTCQFVVRWQPAQNSVQSIASVANGIICNMTFPRGGARVSDCDLYAPGQTAP
jgi:hypothetical protein